MCLTPARYMCQRMFNTCLVLKVLVRGGGRVRHPEPGVRGGRVALRPGSGLHCLSLAFVLLLLLLLLLLLPLIIIIIIIVEMIMVINDTTNNKPAAGSGAAALRRCLHLPGRRQANIYIYIYIYIYMCIHIYIYIY